jgi:zinc carboxypeptidase
MVLFDRVLPPRSVSRTLALVTLAVCFTGSLADVTAQSAPHAPSPSLPGAPFVRDPSIAIDQDYTQKIKEYTTAPYFGSPLVDYLPASKTVPTPKAVLGDIAGAPGILPYSADVHRYMRMLEQAAPKRVKVVSIGSTEEGREMIAVAISSEANMAKLADNRARLAKLADPRTINLDDSVAAQLINGTTPVYYITGSIHAPETGAPTALMELAYRLTVDDHEYIRSIRNNLITLITPIVEVDGRDKMVDTYRWHRAHPDQNVLPLAYWGKYIAHDNNRDAMSVTLKLTENVLNTYLEWKPQVLHDLHESQPYLYDNTVGDGPYNAWIDPILADEWQMLGWQNVSEMTKFGMPGVFTHGDFDTWSPGYLMFVAALHNGISRLYETFGNGGADTVERRLRPEEFARQWYKQNPPLPNTMWSQRNNNNYEQTGLLVSLRYFAQNGPLFLQNFYLKSKRAILKPRTEGPAAYVLPVDDRRPGAQADLLRILQKQGVEISRAKEAFTVTLPAKKPQPARGTDGAASSDQESGNQSAASKPSTPPTPTTRTFAAGSYLVRMDQPYSRIADALLDYQYWSPNDPQKTPYDDTGWTFPELFNVEAVRVLDLKALDVPVEHVSGAVRVTGSAAGVGAIAIIEHNGDTGLATLRYRLKNASIAVAEEPFEAGERKFGRGAFIVSNTTPEELSSVVREIGLKAVSVDSAPSVKTHPVRAPRIAILHSWLSTQSEGWWRHAFDDAHVPYEYISVQDVAADADLASKFDVIVFPPVGRSAEAIINGQPTDWGNPLPWKKTAETPNLGSEDETDDMRPGLTYAGVAHLQRFARAGGLLITSMDTANLAVSAGLTPGVTVGAARNLKIVGSVVRSKIVDGASPIAYGYGDDLSIWCFNGPIFNLTNVVGAPGRRQLGPEIGDRPTGRGTLDDVDVPQGRDRAEIPEEPKAEAWQALPPTDDQLRAGINVIPPAARPRVILRYADARNLLVSGLVEGGAEIAQHPAVVDVPVGKGHVVLFSNNPVWRGETEGSYFLVFNAILNFDNLNAGRTLDQK